MQGVSAAELGVSSGSSGTGALPSDIGHLSQGNFRRLAAFIEEYSGIKMPPSKTTMIEGRLRKRLRATGLRTLPDYCAYLFEQGGLASEAVDLINVVTTNKTEFFREPEHFRFLAEQAVPKLITGRRGTPLKLWSAACSIGAEPYTLAMVMAELGHSISDLRCSITATDICTEALQTAVAGIYPEAMLSPVPSNLRQRYVMRGKDRSRQVARIAPELRSLVRFGRLNLMDPSYVVDRDMDVIFCRNILIYFERSTQELVLRRLITHLRPGGLLFLGHSETIAGNLPELEPAGPTVFRKRQAS